MPLLERVANALVCDGPRADIVDILAGAPYEFLRRDGAAAGIFDRLPKLVARVMKERDTVGVTRAETELQDTVVAMAGGGGGWPPALSQRLLAALDGPCKATCSASGAPVVGRAPTGVPPSEAIKLEVDIASTSPGTVSAKSGWLHRALLNFGAATHIPLLQKRAEMYKSRPASVLVSPEPITPRDCFALRGKSAVALRVAGNSESAMVHHIVIEQLPHWVAARLSLPGRFVVWGEPAASTDTSSVQDPYTVFLGSFDYAAAAPAPQAFELQNPVPLRGLRLVFEAPPTHGPEDFFCIYRIRAFEAKAPSCTDANGKTPARLVTPVRR